jgi:hypothetical protein
MTSEISGRPEIVESVKIVFSKLGLRWRCWRCWKVILTLYETEGSDTEKEGLTVTRVRLTVIPEYFPSGGSRCFRFYKRWLCYWTECPLAVIIT